MAKKWSQPNQPPPPLFIGKKERDLVKQVNDELIEQVIGQQILYLIIGCGEAIRKNIKPQDIQIIICKYCMV